MLENPENLNLIVRYFNHPEDELILAELNEWLKQSKQNEKYFNEIKRIWELSSKVSTLDHLDNAKSEKHFKTALRKISPRPLKIVKWISTIAASILVVCTGYWAFNISNSIVYLTKVTGNQIDSILLTDGSKIILSENSTLKYPEKFNSLKREVYLEHGQAFFQIAKDPKHPFNVLMGESKVSVLGTSFNINYLTKQIDLDVKTGRVMFSPHVSGATSILTAGQALSYNIAQKQLTTRVSQNADSWLTKNLVFVDTPLEDVCKQLSEVYKVDIKLDNKQPQIKKFNATFKSNNLTEVLEVLKETYGFNIKQTKDSILLKTP